METLDLVADIRNSEEKINALRHAGFIPAVYYGRGQKTLPLKLNFLMFNKFYRKAGRTKMIDLKIGEETKKALVHDVQYNPLTEKIIHVDFIHISLTEKITANIPIKFVGVAPAARDMGGLLSTSKHGLSVKCLPQELLNEIEVDISPLVDFHAVIHVKDIKVPASWTIMDKLDDVIVTAVLPKEEKEEVAPVATEVTPAEAEAGTAVAGEKKPEGKGEAAGVGAEKKAEEGKKKK